MFGACKFIKLDDLRTDTASDRFDSFLKTLTTKKGPKGTERAASQQIKNHYLTVVKTFCHWAVASGKIPDCRLMFLNRIKVTDAVQRRAANKDQLATIIKTAEQGPALYDLAGGQRAMLNGTAAGTGFRASLRTCTRTIFT